MSAGEQEHIHILSQLDWKIYELYTSGIIGITVRTIVLQEFVLWYFVVLLLEG